MLWNKQEYALQRLFVNEWNDLRYVVKWRYLQSGYIFQLLAWFLLTCICHTLNSVLQLLVNLEIRNLKVQNALFPTDIQDCLQYKYWITLLFTSLLFHRKTVLKQFLFTTVMCYSFKCLCSRAVTSALHTNFLNKLF